MVKKQRALLALAKAFLIQNPYASNREVMQATDTSQRTVTKARTELVQAGVLQPKPNDGFAARRPAPAEPAPALEVKDAGDLLRAMEAEAQSLALGPVEDLTPEKSKRILSRIALKPNQNPQVVIAAIQAKNKLDFESQDRHALGPGAPMTREGAIDRLAMLMQACGPSIVEAAITRAFARKEPADAASEEAVDAEVARTAPPEAPDAPRGVPDSQEPNGLLSPHRLGEPEPDPGSPD